MKAKSASIRKSRDKNMSRGSLPSLTETTGYFPRRLRVEHGDRSWEANDADVLTLVGPKVILGEPGMGKSQLICEFGRKLNIQPLTASRFMLTTNPIRLVEPGKPLLLDGLDEAIARREGDAVDLILAQLEGIGSPDFILSCRSREWQTRTMTNLRQLYGADPFILNLEPFSRSEARAFLAARHASTSADQVLEHLDRHGVPDFYRNPLTLGLMGRVAEHDQQLPSTRAGLYERACSLVWPEHDANRQEMGLDAITEDQALSAAGAVAASLLLAGAEAASLSGPGNLEHGDLRLLDLKELPGAEEVRTIFSSKLFRSEGTNRAKPIHRVIAEYLGARWLAKWSSKPRTQRRILEQLQGSGGVPASLRGLHAWLAHHSRAMAKQIIVADPLGVLRYGDATTLNNDEADVLLGALQSLTEIDPFFRTQDWDSHAAHGLITPHLRSKIEAIVESVNNNGHLRTLLIEGLKGSELARDMAGLLEAVVESSTRFYRERMAAAEALLPFREPNWWRCTIDGLRAQGTEDSTRLARHLIERIGCDVDDDLLVATLLAELGVTICPLPRKDKHGRSAAQHYSSILKRIPGPRLAPILDLLAAYSMLISDGEWSAKRTIAQFSSELLIRAIEEKIVSSSHAPNVWIWLGITDLRQDFNRNSRANLQTLLDHETDLRHAVQEHALYVARSYPTIWRTHFDLSRRLVPLTRNQKDIHLLLSRMAHADNTAAALREEWRDLMSLAVTNGKVDPELRAESRRFQRGDAELETFVERLENPKKEAWQIRQGRNAAKQAKRRQLGIEATRKTFAASKASLSLGELQSVVRPAKAYLGLYDDLKREQPARDRVAEWLGNALADDAMKGFEAVLHRADLPSPAEIAMGFANDTTWSYGFGVMAGLLARHRAGTGFSGVSHHVLMIGLLLCLDTGRVSVDQDDCSSLRESLQETLFLNAVDRVNFARLWIEPSLAAGCAHVSGLYTLKHDNAWKSTGITLAPRWLMSFTNLPEQIECELVDCLVRAGDLDALVPIAASRAAAVSPSEGHRRTWLAVNLLVRFDVVVPTIAGIGGRDPNFIWSLRNRFELERHGAMVPISSALARWIVSEFRAQWPYAVLQGSGAGNTNPYDATDFIRALIARIADDTSAEGSSAMAKLIADPGDTYSDLVKHMAAEQHQKIVEQQFMPIYPAQLRRLLTGGAPVNADDLRALVLEEMAVAQRVLSGDDLDQVRDFWGDNGIPYDENRCRDRLAAMIGPELINYDVQRITEADMPKNNRADLAFACGAIQLPMEIKGQWHSKVWDAATNQLDLKYLIDWRSNQRGIYCVLWFGNQRASSGRKLKSPPAGLAAPATAEEFRKALIERIPESRRSAIDVVVLDLTSGNSKFPG